MTTPTSKALEEAVERAAAAMCNHEPSYQGTWPGAPQWRWDAADDGVRDYWRRKAKAALASLGLFDGTMWLAPWEATEDMVFACDVTVTDWYTGAKWKAMRDAYLNAERKE